MRTVVRTPIDQMQTHGQILDMATRRSACPCVMKSHIPGRDRWEVSTLLGHVNRSRALDLLLGTEPGITKAQANPVTGRVLIEYHPNELRSSVQDLLERAIAFGPIYADEEVTTERHRNDNESPLRWLLTAELGCVCLKFALAGATCPGIGATLSIAFLLARISRRRRRTRAQPPTAAPAVRVEVDQARGVSDHQNRA